MKKTTIRFIALVAALFIVSPALFLGALISQAQTNTLTPVADSYVKNDAATANFGNATSLDMDTSPNHIAYLKYDLSALADKQISNATLSFSVTNTSTNQQNIRQVENTTWDESTLTFNNRPSISSTTVTSFTPTTTGVYNMNITSFVNANRGNIVTLAIVSSGSNNATIKSKEAASGKPTLTVTIDDGTSPTITPTPPQITTIFDDTLATNFEDWSWNSTNNFASTIKPYSGTKHIEWKPTAAWAGLYLHTGSGFNTTGYEAITFAIQAINANQTIEVQLYDSQNNGIAQPINISAYGGNPVKGSYKVYTILLSALSGTNKIINGLHIQDTTGRATNELYIDAIGFVGSAQPTITTSPVLTNTPTPTVSSTPTPTATLTNTPTPAPVSRLTIYDDALATGFANWGWGSTANFASTAPAIGSKSIDYTATAQWSGLDLHNASGVDTTGYNFFHFALQSAQNGASYALFLLDISGNLLTQPIDLATLGGNPNPNGFTIYNIPLSVLNAVNKTVAGFVFHDFSGSSNSKVFVDDVALTVDAETPTPTPETSNTPTPTDTPTPSPTATLTITPTPTVIITNNVPNYSVEQVENTTKPLAWNTNSWGVNSPVFSYFASGRTGNYSVRTELTNYTSGDAKWYFTPQPLAPETKYTFTDYYQSNIASRVVVEIRKTDGSFNYIELKNAPPSADWSKYQDSFTTPPNTQSVTVLHIISAVGFLITDDYAITNYMPQGFNRALVTVTFDDGWDSQYTTGKAILERYSFPATFYITSGLLNTPNYMTDAMVQSLKDEGYDIAGHTITHPHLPTLSDQDIERELKDSQTDLNTKLGLTIDDFASPYGEIDERVSNVVKLYYRSHRGVINGFNYKDNFDMYNLYVKNILVGTTAAEVQTWINEAAANKAWLILVYHEVNYGGDPYSATPENFTEQMQAISQSSLPVVTLDNALSEISPQLSN